MTTGYAAVPLADAWVLHQTPLPRVIDEALKLYGVKEKVGSDNNPVIMEWAAELGEQRIGWKYTADSIPWCGLGVSISCLRAGKRIPEGPLYALNWAKFGTPVALRQGLMVDLPLIFANALLASLGDVLVFDRTQPGATTRSGHVGFYIGEDSDYYRVLGFNQGDAVSFTWIAKRRCVAIRRPEYHTPPASVRPFRLKRSGAISENEA